MPRRGGGGWSFTGGWLVGWGNFMQKGIFLSTEEEEEGAAPLNIHTGYRQKGTFVLGGSSLF